MKSENRLWATLCVFLILSTLFLRAQTKERADLLVTGGMVVTMDGGRAIYEDGAVVVTGDTIVAVGPSSLWCKSGFRNGKRLCNAQG